MKKLFIILSLIVVTIISVSAEDIPRLITYQGKLTTIGGVGVNDTLPIAFTLYETPTGGTPIWLEIHPSVPVVHGLFDVVLGSSIELDLEFDKQYYLEIKIDLIHLGVLEPRVPFTTSPYAFRAIYADTAFYATYADSVLHGGSCGDSVIYAVYSDTAMAVWWSHIYGIPAGFADNIDNVDDADHSQLNECITNIWFDEVSEILFVYDCGFPVGVDLPVYEDDLTDNVIGDLLDVMIDSVYNGQVLIWEDSMWVPAYWSVPDSVFIWNQDTIPQPGDINIDGSLEVGDIVGQGDAESAVATTHDVDIVGADVSLTSLTYGTYGPGSTVFLVFDGVFDDSNGYTGAHFVLELVRNPGASEVVVASTQVFIYNEDFYRITPMTINGTDVPPTGSNNYEVRARCVGEPFTGGKCLSGTLILSEIKN